MAVAHKGAISFGLVNIPVDLYTATQDISISFNQLHKDCKQRIKYKKTCPACNIDEVKSEDIIKGYEYEENKYVIMNEEDFEKIKTQKDKSISILHFTDLNKIDPIFYEKAYYVVPSGSDKAYSLLKSALESENKVAIGKTVMGTKEHLVTIRPTKECLLIETMYFLDEIKAIPKPFTSIETNQAELEMAKKLINNMTSDFKPELYKDEYNEKVKNAIQQKINGQEVTEVHPQQPSNVIDLMDALKRSVEASKKAQ
jgi:DNA end-binding protein Ku